jgi:ATP:cob(I)alamin adenosyltransferase
MATTKLPVISTKGGDKGETSLWSGERVPKNHPAIKCVCELDLLDSAIGMIYEYLDDQKELHKSLIKIQKRFIDLKGEIATHPRSWSDFYKNFKPITEKDVEYIDGCCDAVRGFLESEGYEITGWIRYGEEGKVSAQLDYIRGLCRKCEINVYDLEDKLTGAKISDPIKQYINRLSDYFYLLARYCRKI